MSVNIASAGSFWPLSVVKQGGKALRVCGPDEDAVTLAVEAGLAALEAEGQQLGAVDGLYVALGATPASEGPLEEILRTALDLPESAETMTFSGSEVAGLAALAAAGDAVAAGRLHRVLVIAAEAGCASGPGAGAAAVVLTAGSEGGVANVETVRRGGSPAFDRWRQTPGDNRPPGDPRFVRHLFVTQTPRVLAAMAAETPQGLPGCAMFTGLSGATGSAVQEMLAATEGYRPRVLPHPGDSGVASPLLGLLSGLQKLQPGERMLLVGSGSGQTVVIALSAGTGAATQIKAASDQQRVLEAAPAASLPRLSLPAYSPFFWRSAAELLRGDAARCQNCGQVVYPPTSRPICPRCHGTEWEAYRLPRRGSVYTYTINHYLPADFPKTVIYALAELEDGNRYWAAVTDMDAAEVKIGTPVRLVFRRFTQDGGALVYGLKITGDSLQQAGV